MLTIGKRQEFEKETQEVLNTYTKRVIEADKDPGGPENLWSEGKGQGYKAETKEVLSTYRKGEKEAGIWNRDSGGPEHL